MHIKTLLLIAVLALCAACNRSSRQQSGIVATTTMLGDMVAQLVGTDIEIKTLIAPGADPHIYRPTPAHAASVAGSQMVVMNGLHLEGWADALINNAGGERASVVAGDGVNVHQAGEFVGGVDPHFWFDVIEWRDSSQRVAAAIAAEWPEHAESITERAESYAVRLEALDVWTRTSIATIPEEHRVLVTSHDAFNYFGRAYEIEVVGIQGISTQSEPSQRDVAIVIDTIRESGAPAVFAETSVNPTLIQRVASETGVPVAGALYSDSVGAPGSGAETYEGMIVANVRSIVGGLGGTVTEFVFP
jgi:ABC-type Zn uptake system ZnuABC Zn-binding protein ZnuA